MKRHVIVFAKAPVAGRVKTRLAARLGEPAALAAYRSLLEQTLSTVASVAAITRELCVAGEDPGGDCARWAERFGFSLSRQSEGDLGVRMQSSLDESLNEGLHPVLIGSDCPALTGEDILDAFAALESHDAVFAPTEDGGYALVGVSKRIPSIFTGIPWSTSSVMDLTRQRLEAARCKFALLRTVWDVDELKDWHRWQEQSASG